MIRVSQRELIRRATRKDFESIDDLMNWWNECQFYRFLHLLLVTAHKLIRLCYSLCNRARYPPCLFPIEMV
jgi:hypothetical protein